MLLPRSALVLAALVGMSSSAFLSACASSRPTPFDGPSYDLPSISDVQPQKAQLAYVLLKPEGNLLSLFNTEYGYNRVEIYRRSAAMDSLQHIGTAAFPPPPDMHSIASVLLDSLGASLDSRYEFRPYMGEAALSRLPVTYATSDSAYAAQIESR